MRKNNASTVHPLLNLLPREQIVTGRPCEVQEVSTRGVVGGTFTLTYGGETTTEILWNSTSETVRAALEVRWEGLTWFVITVVYHMDCKLKTERKRAYGFKCTPRHHDRCSS